MKKIIFILILAGIGAYLYKNPNALNYENKSLPSTYQILNSQEEWSQKLISSETSRIWDVREKNIIIEGNYYDGNFTCGNQKAKIVGYKYNEFLRFIKKGERISIVDCGDYYFVLYYNDSDQKLYGPFDK